MVAEILSDLARAEKLIIETLQHLRPNLFQTKNHCSLFLCSRVMHLFLFHVLWQRLKN